MPDRKSTRLNSSHLVISYAVFCLKKKKKMDLTTTSGRQTIANTSVLSLDWQYYGLVQKISSFIVLFLPRHRRQSFLFFFNDTATTEIYTLSLHDPLPI